MHTTDRLVKIDLKLVGNIDYNVADALPTEIA